MLSAARLVGKTGAREKKGMQNKLGILFAVVVTAVAVTGCKPLTNPTYDTCYAAADCSSAFDSCVLVMSTSNDRMCSRPCSVGADCPSSRNGDPYGVCLPVANGDSYCYSACTRNSDCPVGWICNTGTIRGAACTPQ